MILNLGFTEETCLCGDQQTMYIPILNLTFLQVTRQALVLKVRLRQPDSMV